MGSVSNEVNLAANGTTGAQPAWKRELNDKIAAARARRLAGQQQAAPLTAREGSDANSRASRVAAAVAARYADAPSYSEYLAAEVRAALMAAVAEQAAANQARAAAGPSIEQAPGEEKAAPAMQALPAPEVPQPAPRQAAARRPKAEQPAPRVDLAAAGFPYATSAQTPPVHTTNAVVPPQDFAASPLHLSDPLEEAIVTPATALPAKLLEFPRELIAARKARPRHAEGPLRDGITDAPGQLRIFEVEASAVSTRPEAPPQATEWSSIRLDAYPPQHAEDEEVHGTAVTSREDTAAYNQPVAHAQVRFAHHAVQPIRRQDRAAGHIQESLPQVAGVSDRLMAGIVDAALVAIAFVLFVFVFAASTAHPPSGRPAVLGAAIVLTIFYLLYQLLFFTYAEATPGMRYARIALCTFDDDNPSRVAMRKRIFALVLAAAPLGLGFLYALFDEDRLGWHDRMTRMYQRSYK